MAKKYLDENGLLYVWNKIKSNFVLKVKGKDLSTNDFTDDYKSKLDSANTNNHTHSNKSLLDAYTQSDDNLKDAVSKKHSHSNKALLDTITTAKVNEWNEKSEFSGAYSDLTGLPVIPTKVSELTNDKNYLTSIPTASSTVLGGVKVGAGLSITNGVLSADGGGTADAVEWTNVLNKPDSLSDFTDDVGYEKTANKVTKITSNSKDSEYPSAKATWDLTYGQVNNLANQVTQVISIMEMTSNKVTEITESSTDAQYPSAKSVYDLVSNKLSSVMKYKGTVASYNDLPTNPSIGDTYNITNAGTNNDAGDNAVWNGSSWDILSGTVDLTDYLLSADLVAITNAEIDTIVAS